MLFGKNLLSLFNSSQSQSYLIYSQIKVKDKLIYIQIFLFAICILSFVVACVITLTAYAKQLVYFCTLFVCSIVWFWSGVCDAWVAFEHLVFALFDRVYVIFYTSFELFYLASLTQLCIIRHWDLLLSHNDTSIELFAVYRFYPVKKSNDFVLDLIFKIATSVHTSHVTKISFG